MNIRTATFWDHLFSDDNMRSIAASFSEGVPITLTALLTLAATLVTTAIADRRRRRETKALADAALAEKQADRKRDERREYDSRWYEEIRSASIRMLTASIAMAKIRDQRLSLSKEDPADHPQWDFPALLEESAEIVLRNHREISSDLSALMIFAPNSLFVAGQQFVRATLDVMECADEDVETLQAERRAASARFLNEVRSHLHVDDPAKWPGGEV